MKLAPRNETCTCPEGNDLVATSCPLHFGIGLGYCGPHMVKTETLVAAVELRDEVGLCAGCLAEANAKRPRGAPKHLQVTETGIKLKHRDNDGSQFWVFGQTEEEARNTIASLVATAQRHRCLCRQIPIKGFPPPTAMAPTFVVELDDDGTVKTITEKLAGKR